MGSKYNYNKFVEACRDSGGIITTIAQRLQVERLTVYDWIQKHPEVKPVIEQEREKIVDMAESSLFVQVKEKQPWATKFLLKTVGRSRGYVEKQEVEHQGAQPIRLMFEDEGTEDTKNE